MIGLCLGLTCLAAGPQPARKALDRSERLAVVPVLIGASAENEVGAVFRSIARASAFRPIQPMSVDDYFFQDGEDLSARAEACGGDTECLAVALAAFRADLGLVVVVNRDVSPALLGLVLVQTEGRLLLGERSETLGEAPIPEQIERAARAVFDDAGLLESGRLEVRLRPAHAHLEVPEQARVDSSGTLRFILPPGRYMLRASAPEHESKEREVDIRRAEAVQVDLHLEPRSRAFWESPWFWVGVAPAAAAGAVTAAALASSGEADCLCVTTRGDDTCIGCP